MRLWSVHFITSNPVDFLPRIHEIVYERQRAASYRIGTRYLAADEAQIVCTISGEGRFSINNHVYTLSPGRAFCCRLNEPETVYYYPENGESAWDFLWVSFSGLSSIRCIQQLNKQYGFVVDIPRESEFIQKLLEYKKLNEKVQFSDCFHSGAEAAYLLELFDRSQKQGKELDHTEFLVRQVQKMILENLSCGFSMKKIADRLQVSREHLCRSFKAETGETPGIFAMRERMKQAHRMIRDEQLTCSETADRLGFSSAASFIRSYKNWYGVTPFKQFGKQV